MRPWSPSGTRRRTYDPQMAQALGGLMPPSTPLKLSAEERRLIDEAVAQGRVRKIPTGVSGYVLPAEVTPKKTTQVKQARGLWERSLKMRSRARAIRDMDERGVSTAEIARILGVSNEVIRSTRARAKLTASSAKPGS